MRVILFLELLLHIQIRLLHLFSNQLSTEEHTFLDHKHPFAIGLREIVSEMQKDYKEFRITKEWLGTNRCAIQTNRKGCH